MRGANTSKLTRFAPSEKVGATMRCANHATVAADVLAIV
jgi:hypothetical protein